MRVVKDGCIISGKSTIAEQIFGSKAMTEDDLKKIKEFLRSKLSQKGKNRNN